jgi:hypothetical protein
MFTSVSLYRIIGLENQIAPKTKYEAGEAIYLSLENTKRSTWQDLVSLDEMRDSQEPEV